MLLTKILPDTFQQILPQLDPWVSSLKTLPLAKNLQDIFKYIEILHILGLFILGGATLLTSLRLMNVGLTEVPTAEVEKQTRPWFTFGVIMSIVSGLLIGITNADKLYNNTAFLAKMLALAAGVIFTYLVVLPTAQKGSLGIVGKIGLVLGLGLGLLALFYFAVTEGLNPGFFHLLWFGALICLTVVQGKTKWLFTLGLVVIAAVWQLWTHVIKPLPSPGSVGLEELKPWYAIDHTFLTILTVWIFGMAALNIFGVAAKEDSTKFKRLVGYVAILIWITVGAGGRWIGLS